MVQLENQVCSLELAKKLKELGVEQESLFWWRIMPSERYELSNARGDKYWLETHDTKWKDFPSEKMDYSAFTVAELTDLIPSSYYKMLIILKRIHVYGVRCDGAFPIEEIQEARLADALAKMLIQLIEKGLVQV